MSESKFVPVIVSWRSAIADSGLAPTTRLVAQTLTLWMSARGESAFPSAPTLAKATGLGVSTVREHLHLLVSAGYLVLVRPSDGRQRGNEYAATIPVATPPAPGPLQLPEATPPANGADPSSSRRQLVHELSSELGASPPDGGPDRNEVASLVAGYVEDFQAERDGHQPSRRFKAACGQAAKAALKDGETVEDVARCLGVIAHESKNPTTLPYVLADMHAGRERRMR